MDLQQKIEATIADFNLNDMPARRTTKRIMQLIKDFNQSPQAGSEAVSECMNLLCFYVAYEDKIKKSWRILTTEFDLDSASGLQSWIEEKESEEGSYIIPIFWKRLKKNNAELRRAIQPINKEIETDERPDH